MSRGIVALLFGGILWAAPAVFGAADPPAQASEVVTGPRAVLQWKARSEQGTYGYLVYRANSEDGPYLRVNPEIIHAGPHAPDEASDYRFVDRDVVPDRTYYYYLDTIDDSGRKTRFSKVISKTVTGP